MTSTPFSAIYFLSAFDKRNRERKFDDAEGKKIRTEFSLEFYQALGIAKQKSVIGFEAVTFGRKSPRQRLSSNFLTTHIPSARKQT